MTDALLGLAAGLAAGAVGAATWIAADAAGYGYGPGFVGAADGTRAALGERRSRRDAGRL